MQSIQKSTVLATKADCHLHLFWKTYPNLHRNRVLDPKRVVSEKITEEYVLDLQKRVKIAQDPHLLEAFKDYLASRSSTRDAKNFVDPKLNQLKAIVNEFLRQ